MKPPTRGALLLALIPSFLTACGGPSSDEPYSVVVDPASFVTGVDNPYFPLTPGTTLIYEGLTADGSERIEDAVTRETKVILGVRCVVVHNRVTLDGQLIEETLDWYAQDAEGNVWYFGEDTKEYEGGEVVSTSGTWEAGVDGAQPGIIMQASPQIGQAYRQEYYNGEAEDMAEVLSLTEATTIGLDSFQEVWMMREWSALDPSVVEHKYYARGIGLILETVVEGGSGRIELVARTTE